MRRLALLLPLVLLTLGCDDDPAAPEGSRLIDQLGVALAVGDPGLTTSRAFDLASEATITVRADETVLADTTIELSSSGESRLELELTVESGLQELVVDVELSGEGFLLFTGSAAAEIGDRDVVTVSVPLDPVLGSLEPAMDVATAPTLAGPASSTCALNVHGELFCWGDRPWRGEGGDLLRPTREETDVRFVEIEGGEGTFCGLTEAGEAYCWGFNGLGQLGDGTKTTRVTPTAVTGGLTFRAISSGSGFTCAVTVGGEVYCWGRADSGQLGREGSETCGGSELPCDPLPAPIPGLGGVTDVSAGLGHACSTGAEPVCWGWNAFSQLGIEPTEEEVFLDPQRVSADTDRLLRAGTIHSCGLDSAGAAVCWGNAFFDGTAVLDFGQLGDGAFDGGLVPTPVAGGFVFRTLALSEANNVFGQVSCGITEGGGAHCWGVNIVGALGAVGGEECTFQEETFDCSSAPVAVDTGAAFVEIATSGQHSCGVTTERTVLCWGLNAQGQLGDGTTTDRATPVRAGD